MSLERRITSLEARASGADSKGEVPIEALLLLKAVARHHARERGEELPSYSQEELEEMHREDLDTVAGGGVAGHLRSIAGWQSPEALDRLDEWGEDARERLERVQDGEPLEVVYNDDEEE